MNNPVFLLPLVASAALAFGSIARAELALDPTFNPDGVLPGSITLELGPRQDVGNDIVVQADGKPVLVGYAQVTVGAGGLALAATAARFTTVGEPDPDFGTDGFADLDLFGVPVAGGGAQAQAVIIQPADQKVVIAGTVGVSASIRRVFVLRLDTDGAPDPGFGNNGLVVIEGLTLDDVVVQDLDFQADGGLLVIGDNVAFGSLRGFVLRLLADGTVDANFGSGGVRILGDPAEPDEDFSLSAVRVLDDDSLLVAGGASDITVVRLSAAGELDTSFATDGYARVNVSTGFGGTTVDSFDRASAIDLDSDGRILVGGFTQPDPPAFVFNGVLLRLTPAGVLDGTYGAGGIRILGSSSGAQSVTSLVVRPGDDVVIGGFGLPLTQISATGSAVAELTGDFAPTNVPGLTIDPDGRIVGGGTQDFPGASPPNSAQVLFRLTVTDLPDGTDTTPDAFSFPEQTGTATSSVIVSAPAVITGIDAPAPVSVTGGEYSVGCTDIFTAVPGTILTGEAVCVRHTSAAALNTPTITTLTIGGVSADFTSTTTPFGPDTPFEDRLDVRLQTTVTSNAFAIAGLGAPIAVTVENGEYSIGCDGNWTRDPGTIGNGDTLCLRHITPAQLSTPTVTTVTLGGTVFYTFTSVTVADKPLPGSSAIDPLALLLLAPALLAGRRRRKLATA